MATPADVGVATSTVAAPSPPKYIPPPKRKQMEEERRLRELGIAPPSQPAIRPMSDEGRGGFNSYNSRSNPRQGYHNFPSRGPGQVAERWKDLDGSSDARRDGDYRSRSSATGTGWDIRDGRSWRPENMAEVFHEEGAEKSTGINFGSYDNIPVELSGNRSAEIQPLASFKAPVGGVHKLLLENIIRVDYEKPTPVQKNSIPVILAGRDLMACAQTGSGKTAAFLFPIITRMLMSGPPKAGFSKNRVRQPAFPVALILSPTRELAVQIYKEARKFAFGTGIKTVVVYGGSEVYSQLQSLKSGCDICVATPGRFSEFANRGSVALDSISYFVLDEADRMLDMGFAPQIYSIVDDHSMPSPKEGRQTVMFSATFPSQIQKLAGEFLNEYIFLTVGRVGSTNEFIKQNFIYANEEAKPKRLLSVLEESKSGLVLETKKKADLIERFLQDSGLPAVSLHGDKCQAEREQALQLFRTGRKPILVATDVAARGLDIHNIEHVINCDLPARIEDYVHRIGRTGRAGNGGKATSFVNEQNRSVMRDLLGLLQEAQQEIPSWFYEMVKSCTSAYRGFASGTSTFGKSQNMSRGGGGGGTRQVGFGGRDVRGDNRSGPTLTRSMPISKLSNTVDQEDEDGW